MFNFEDGRLGNRVNQIRRRVVFWERVDSFLDSP